jgi:hypothetical protein
MVVVLHQKRPLSEDDAYLHPESLAFPTGSREASPTLATMAANSMAAAAAAARFVPSMVDPQLLGAAINGTHEDSMTAKALEYVYVRVQFPRLDVSQIDVHSKPSPLYMSHSFLYIPSLPP